MPSNQTKVRIFAYGLLKPEYDLPRTATDVHHDSVRGRLYDLGADAAMKDIGNALAPWCRGYTMDVDRDEWEKIQKFEHPQYHARVTETWAGHQVEIFEYSQKIPIGAKSTTNWTLDEIHKGRKAAAAKVK